MFVKIEKPEFLFVDNMENEDRVQNNFSFMNTQEQQYLDLLQKILDTGADRSDRTGVGTRSIFGHQMRFDLSKGFPLLTTKKVFLRAIIHELIWFIS